MEDGVKEEPTQRLELRSAEKAGWLKKSSGKFLSGYKDRYIQLDRTVIAIYENEELTTCLEKLDLDNFDSCHDLKSAFKKKHRLVLIRSPKSGNKIHDVKLQAPSPEEKEAWIKAFCEGISKAKNKILDEVKVDQTCSLEHVTRNRPKGNRGRRPPTRVHMKEVANVASDGILRLDLDGEVTMLNGTHSLSEKEVKPTEQPLTINKITEEETDLEITQQRNTLNPPIPPSKETNKQDEVKNEEQIPQKIFTPPVPPSKENKPREINTEDEVGNGEPVPQKNILTAPTPPSKESKPKERDIEDEVKNEEQVKQRKILTPPVPPSKENKPREINTEDEVRNEEPMPQKNILTPPTPPSKESKPKERDIEDEVKNEEEVQQRKILTPPSPPSKEKKLRESNSEDVLKNEELLPENKIHTPSTPPIKVNKPRETNTDELKNEESPPMLRSIELKPCVSTTLGESKVEAEPDSTNSTETSLSNKIGQPPVPSKHTKPNQEGSVKTEKHEAHETLHDVDSCENITVYKALCDKDGHKREETRMKWLLKPQVVMWDSPTIVSNVTEQEVQTNLNKISDNNCETATTLGSQHLGTPPVSRTELVKKGRGPPARPKKKPSKFSELSTEKVLEQSFEKAEVLSNAKIDTIGEDIEEKSLDSGQHSGEETESCDLVTTSSRKLKGSSHGLDLETSEDDLEPSDINANSLGEPSPETLSTTPEASLLRSFPAPSHQSKPLYHTMPLKRSSKGRSSSLGDLLAEDEEKTETKGKEMPMKPHGSNIKVLQTKVSLEIEKTGELLNAITAGQSEDQIEASPEMLLSEAMEKLRKADQFLREARCLKDRKRNRLSL
ncbi:hypothetical protein DNTS_018518 [Danionella cerebrum]|uniref:PH domain-containing protein n=1 Tax=Danionella cerebrum TaxID=2873325 RepID=A0A553Q194_9TELE|nr:hypothetical protein DNTS_018518 [Danionella translucida]